MNTDYERREIELKKMMAETDHLINESRKFYAEANKAFAEAMKSDRERWWYPALVVVGLLVATKVIDKISLWAM